MPRVVYNRKLNEKPRIFKFFTYWEFTVLLFILVLPVVIGNILDLPPTFMDSIILLVLFSIYIARFKLGRPEGYFAHWIKSFSTFKHFRPGHVSKPLPIDLPESPVPTPADLADTELRLLNEGFYYFAPGRALPVEAVLPEVLEDARQLLESGNPLSMTYYVLDETISPK
jgi:hypothetical protein